MALVGQFFSHRAVACKTKKPEQLIDPEGRWIMARFTNFFTAQICILFFHRFLKSSQFGKGTAGRSQYRLRLPGLGTRFA